MGAGEATAPAHSRRCEAGEPRGDLVAFQVKLFGIEPTWRRQPTHGSGEVGKLSGRITDRASRSPLRSGGFFAIARFRHRIRVDANAIAGMHKRQKECVGLLQERKITVSVWQPFCWITTMHIPVVQIIESLDATSIVL